MYPGIDLGTSSLNVVLLATDGRLVAQHPAPLEVSRPHPQWSEQAPSDWWRALGAARLAGLADGGDPARVCARQAVIETYLPSPKRRPALVARHARFRALYPLPKNGFRD